MGFSSVWNEITAGVNVKRAHGQWFECEVGDNRAYIKYISYAV